MGECGATAIDIVVTAAQSCNFSKMVKTKRENDDEPRRQKNTERERERDRVKIQNKIIMRTSTNTSLNLIDAQTKQETRERTRKTCEAHNGIRCRFAQHSHKYAY